LREDRDGRKRDPLGWKVFVEQPVTEVYAGLQATVYRSIALLVAGVLFSILAAMWLAGTMVRPIREMQEAAEKIGEGDLDTQITVRTGDELQALAGTFNKMTAQLRESYAGLERKVEERTNELTQTLERQTATAEILRAISGAQTDVQPVFEVIARSAQRLLNGRYGLVVRKVDDTLHLVAHTLTSETGAASLQALFPTKLTGVGATGKAILGGKPAWIVDVETDPGYSEEFRAGARSRGYRSQLTVPIVAKGEPIGAITVTRSEAGEFSDQQVRLLQTFADQAVIAIENVRLFNETKEALEHQTATSEILGVINSSPTRVEPVFDAIVNSATTLFPGWNSSVVMLEGDLLYRRAWAGPRRLDEDSDKAVQKLFPMPFDPATVVAAKVIADAEVVEVPDAEAPGVSPRLANTARTAGYRSIVFVPLLREGKGIGVIGLNHVQAGLRFTPKQLALVRTFARQAVIAIENARLFREIQDKSAQLEVANKHKSDFLANMSHELRTPLNAIIGFSEVLMEKMFGEVNEKQADYLKDIHESGRHLLSLINDILDLSKIEAGRMDLEVSSFHLPSALSNAMTLVRERAQRHGIALDLKLDKRLAEFNADERKFKQILLNLLSNAVKFTADGGRVDVSANLNGKAVEIAVKDTGIGIAAEDQQKVFAEFVQVGRDYTRKAEGTGLGLALTKRFVELHGGEIRLESVPGRGSTFTFTIPIRP
jgi:signal transduction histidine kinase